MSFWEVVRDNQLWGWEITCKLLATQLESLKLEERCISMNIYSDIGDYIIDSFMYKTELSVNTEMMYSESLYFSKVVTLLAL